MMISDERIRHMHGVAEWMYAHAEDYGCFNKEEMYLLGLIHDIGYIYGEKYHEQLGGQLLGQDAYYGQLIFAHGLSPQEYMEYYGVNEEEIPCEMVLLWTADMRVDLSGKDVGYEKRLMDIKKRYGFDSEEYVRCRDTMTWLEKREAFAFLGD